MMMMTTAVSEMMMTSYACDASCGMMICAGGEIYVGHEIWKVIVPKRTELLVPLFDVSF